VGVHSSGRFIEKKQLGPKGESACDLEATLIAIREIGRCEEFLAGEPDKGEELPSLTLGCALGAAVAGCSEDRIEQRIVDGRVETDDNVIEDGKVPDEPVVLVGPRDAESSDKIRPEPGY